MAFLLEDEKILTSVRRHWFFIAVKLLAIGFIAFVPLILLIIKIIFDLYLGPEFEKNFMALFIFFYSMWFLVVWMWAFAVWTNYYLCVWHVTNERIIDVEQTGLFYRNVSSLRLDFIQDVTINTRGTIQAMLEVADLVIETASENGSFVLRDAADAESVKQFILTESRRAHEESHAVHFSKNEPAVK